MAQSYEELYRQLLDWHKAKHQFAGDNRPAPTSEPFLAQLINQILLPVSAQLGNVHITYGFTGPALCRYIQRLSRAGTAPRLDQHANAEVNSMGREICNRPGAACDFIVHGFKEDMHLVVQFVCQQLSFDKLYFYGRNRPFHISVSNNPLMHLQVMHQNEEGRRYPGKRAFGHDVLDLAKRL